MTGMRPSQKMRCGKRAYALAKRIGNLRMETLLFRHKLFVPPEL